MRTNSKPMRLRTHEGGTASHINAEQELRRSVLANMLFEDTFYEDGEDIATRITNLIPKVKPDVVAALAKEARITMKLRHVPLLIARTMAALDTHKHLVSDTLATIIQRPDELAEFLAIYWKDGKCPVSAQVKKGLAKAFLKFDEYSFAKYNRDNEIKLRDALFLCHAKPQNKEQEALFKKIVDNSLQTPDTWEVALSAGKDKKETWERLLSERKLGGLALLRNLRNMDQVGVNRQYIISALEVMKTDRILPYRFIAAARYAMQYEPQLELCMMRSIKDKERIFGRTILLVDISGSMDVAISSKSDLTRIDAACGLAILVREICNESSIFAFSDGLYPVPPRRGFALRDAINQFPHGGTYLGNAIRAAIQSVPDYERVVVITDEQAHDNIPSLPSDKKCYMINVAPYKHGVGYGAWNHVTGFSEHVLDWITEYEKIAWTKKQ